MGLLRGLNADGDGADAVEGLASHARLAAAVASRDIAEAGRLAYSGAAVTMSGRSCALMMAIESGQDEMVEILAERADLSACDVFGRTALMLAAEAGHARMVAALLRQGASANRPGNGGVTPLMAAAGRGHLGACSALVRHGDLGKRDDLGLGPLEHAAMAGKAMCVQLILENGGGRFGPKEIRAAMEMAAELGAAGTATIDALAKRLAWQEAQELAWTVGGGSSGETEVDRRQSRI